MTSVQVFLLALGNLGGPLLAVGMATRDRVVAGVGLSLVAPAVLYSAAKIFLS